MCVILSVWCGVCGCDFDFGRERIGCFVNVSVGSSYVCLCMRCTWRRVGERRIGGGGCWKEYGDGGFARRGEDLTSSVG